MLGDLSAQYESNGDPGCISDGYGDPGGKSYGSYQLSSNAGSLQQYINWLGENGYWFYNTLIEYPLTSDAFDTAWKTIANSANRDDFEKSQHDYIKSYYYDPAIEILSQNYFTIDSHADVMKDVVWSRAVQYGPGNILDMFNEACSKMYNKNTKDYSGYPNMSYINDKQYDYDFIYAIYILVCSSYEWNHSALKDSLNNRFKNECNDAIARL